MKLLILLVIVPITYMLQLTLCMCSHAKRNSEGNDPEFGLGNGFIDIFSLDGVFITRLINRGALNALWGIVCAGREVVCG